MKYLSNEEILDKFEELMTGKTIGTLIKGEKGKVFVDGEYKLEIGRIKSFITSLRSQDIESIRELLADGPMLAIDTPMGHFVKYDDVIRLLSSLSDKR